MPQAGAPPTTPQPPPYGTSPTPTPPPPPTAKTLCNVLRAGLKAAATTAKALADSRVTAPQGHRRGGQPPPTRKERPRARRRRLQRSVGTPAPRVTDTHTVIFWGSSFNDGTTQTALDPLGGGPVRTLSHGHAVSKDPAGPAQSSNRQQPLEGRTNLNPTAASLRSTHHLRLQQPCRQLRLACDPLCPAPEPSCNKSEWQGHHC
jgi:hypothetical protein